MQGISSYISCIKLVITISKIGFKKISIFKSLILAWNSSSTQQLVWHHGLATSRHAIPGFVHIDSNTFLFQAITSTLLLHTQILVTLPCSPLDKLSNTYPHASFWPWVWKPHHFKNDGKTHHWILVWNVNFSHLELLPFHLWQPAENFTENFPLLKSGLIPSKIPTLWWSKQQLSSSAHWRPDHLFSSNMLGP